MPQFLKAWLEFNTYFGFFVFSRILDTEKNFKNLWNFKQQVKFGRSLEQY